MNTKEQRQEGMKQIICPQAPVRTSNGKKKKTASKTATQA